MSFCDFNHLIETKSQDGWVINDHQRFFCVAGEEKKKSGDGEQSEYEDEDDGYGEEDYDEEGKYKWGNEGNDWDWYYKEDKEAYERGDPMPNTLNPPVMIDKEQIERAVAAHKEN